MTISPTGLRSRRESGRRHAGFTLIEVLLVVAILLIMLTLALPKLGQAIEGSRLTFAARTVASAHRYARAMAVLNQQEIVLIYDFESPILRVVQVKRTSPAPADASDPFGIPEVSSSNPEAGNAEEPEPTYTVEPILTRSFDPAVRIERISGLSDLQERSGKQWVDYRPNGMTDSYEVDLADRNDEGITVRINGITGRVEMIE
ncbi:MAG: prepilin-type N-terminal cleavage/methylation domain-containing protein [Kiritimatiellae bacterium]|nr:prepilin-type N-terminal cleavage/methylation domain-containing protein [Kiritimatiellia bacterium]